MKMTREEEKKATLFIQPVVAVSYIHPAESLFVCCCTLHSERAVGGIAPCLLSG